MPKSGYYCITVSEKNMKLLKKAWNEYNKSTQFPVSFSKFVAVNAIQNLGLDEK